MHLYFFLSFLTHRDNSQNHRYIAQHAASSEVDAKITTTSLSNLRNALYTSATRTSRSPAQRHPSSTGTASEFIETTSQ
jgi:hypothetical protein